MEQPNHSDRPDALTNASAAEGAPASDAGSHLDSGAAPPALTPVEWLKVNGPLLAVVAAGCIWLYSKNGFDGLYRGLLVAVGLGLVVFIHELGHFLAAKWCDVHVQTFSIGFGPALPGCSFQRGETLYKIAVLPLGGYVNMVGEGLETDEGESYPRSFKNKTVGQRMLIISAGVVMNVILGCVCYVIVYRYHGEPRQPAGVARVEPGSPAWRHGVQSGMAITELNGIKDPWWDDLKIEVASSSAGQQLPFVFRAPDGATLRVDLTPRLEEDDPAPAIGVAAPHELRLIQNKHYGRGPRGLPPYHLMSAAAGARAVALQPGDIVVACSDPDREGAVSPLPVDKTDPQKAYTELGRRMMAFAGKKQFIVEVRRRGKDAVETVDLPPQGFAFDDAVVGTSDPLSDDPFAVLPLPPETGPKPDAPDARDFHAFYRRMQQLAGRTVVVQVSRGTDETPVHLLVPPGYHRTLGLRMTMQKIAAVRVGSPAERAGVEPGDLLTKVVLKNGSMEKEFNVADSDPTRLPFDLQHFASRSAQPTTVALWVTRGGKETKEVRLPTEGTVEWDHAFDYTEELPNSLRSPLSVPQLGLAYRIESRVAAVEPGSPADAAGLLRGDVVEQIRFRLPPDKQGGPQRWDRWVNMKAKAPSGPERWAAVFVGLQGGDLADVQLQIKRGDTVLYFPGAMETEPTASADALTAVADPTWPLAERGLIFQPDMRLQKTDSLTTALGFGVKRTGDFIRQIYLSLRALASRRISSDNMAGPLGIAEIAFDAAGQDPFILLLFLGMISVNLAVVNALPIPLLDGGHMVFLVYEKLRGRPPSDAVRAAATYVGLAMIGSLMFFVIYLDVKRHWF